MKNLRKYKYEKVKKYNQVFKYKIMRHSKMANDKEKRVLEESIRKLSEVTNDFNDLIFSL